MYKRPTKRQQRIRLIVTYTLMTLTVVAVVAVLVPLVSNYRFNQKTGTFEQRGLVQFASTPSGASVMIDGVQIGSRTSTKSSVEPGSHSFSVYRDGYESWDLTTSVDAGSLVWLNYVRLVPKERTAQSINRYETLAASSASPEGKSLLLQRDAAKPELRLVDISGAEATGKTITLPEEVYRATPPAEGEEPAVHTFTLDKWDKSGRYILVWSSQGDTKELIVLDTQNPQRSVNVSREFSLPITDAALSGRSGNILYVVSEGSLRKLDVSGGTISRSLVGNVESFSLYDTNTIAYVARTENGDEEKRSVGIYREGDTAPTELRGATGSPAPRLSIATGTYYNTSYTAITEGAKIFLYKGHFDNGIKGLELVAQYTSKTPITAVEFNQTGGVLLARADTSFTSYTIERKAFSEHTLASGKAADLFWLDPMHLGLSADGVITMRDVDGTNVHGLTGSTTGQAATLTSNGTFLYTIAPSGHDGAQQLQRIRMILK